MLASPGEGKFIMICSRERIKLALDHKEPDRVPIDLGGIAGSISTRSNELLLVLMGIDSEEHIMDRVQQNVIPCDELLKRLSVDTRCISLNPPYPNFIRLISDWSLSL